MSEVIIIGGGPAGLNCAYYLAKSGKDVILLEKHAFTHMNQRDQFNVKCGDLTPDFAPFFRVAFTSLDGLTEQSAKL